jgi:hypothetical protein
VARKEDAEKDPQSKAILEQLNTFTVGPPPASTGLVGDQTPAGVMDPVKFDTVKNQMTLQMSNLEALNVLNTIGLATGSQSSSGPLVGSYNNPMMKLVSVTTTTQGTVTWFRPDPGEVWVLQAAAVIEDDSSYHNIFLMDDAGTDLFVGQETGGTLYNPSPHLKIYGSYDLYWAYNIPTSPGGGNNTIRGAFYRIR